MSDMKDKLIKSSKIKAENTDAAADIITGGFSFSASDKQDISVLEIGKYIDRNGNGQPYRPMNEKKMNELISSVQANGVLSPLIIRPVPDGNPAARAGYKYQLLAGHNRLKAARMAGLTKVPCIIKDVDDATAAAILVDTNEAQRDEILPSERAKAYRLKYDTAKAAHKRGDGDIVEQIAGKDSIRTVQRYLAISQAHSTLLGKVDKGLITVDNAAKLAQLPRDQQIEVAKEIKKKINDEQLRMVIDLMNSDLNPVCKKPILHSILNDKKEKPKTNKLSVTDISEKLSSYAKELKCVRNSTDAEVLIKTIQSYIKTVSNSKLTGFTDVK